MSEDDEWDEKKNKKNGVVGVGVVVLILQESVVTKGFGARGKYEKTVPGT